MIVVFIFRCVVLDTGCNKYVLRDFSVVILRCATPTSFLVRIAARGSSPDFFSFIESSFLFVSVYKCEVIFGRVKCILFLLQFGIID